MAAEATHVAATAKAASRSIRCNQHAGASAAAAKNISRATTIRGFARGQRSPAAGVLRPLGQPVPPGTAAHAPARDDRAVNAAAIIMQP